MAVIHPTCVAKLPGSEYSGHLDREMQEDRFSFAQLSTPGKEAFENDKLDLTETPVRSRASGKERFVIRVITNTSSMSFSREIGMGARAQSKRRQGRRSSEQNACAEPGLRE